MNYKISLIIIILIFAGCSQKEKKKANLNLPKEEAIVNLKKDTISSVDNPKQKKKLNYVLLNYFYRDTIFEEELIIPNNQNLEISDTLTNCNIGVFKGKWLDTNLGKDRYYIPDFFVSKELDLSKFELDFILKNNSSSIDYKENVNDVFSSSEKITFKNFDKIEPIYFLIKRLYENTNNTFPLKITNKGVYNKILHIDFKENEQGLYFLELKWLFEGGDLIIVFKKEKTNICVYINEDYG